MKSKQILAQKTAAAKKAPAKKTVKPVEPAAKIPDHFIKMKVANEMIAAGREKGLLYPVDFHIGAFKEMIAQKGAVYIRIFATINKKGEQTYVMMPVDKNKHPFPVKRPANAKPNAKVIPEDGAMDLGQACDPVMKVYS